MNVTFKCQKRVSNIILYQVRPKAQKYSFGWPKVHIRHFCFDFCSDQGRGVKLDQSDCPISPGNFKHTIVQKIITVYVSLNMLTCQTMNSNINILAYNVQQIFSINYNFTYTLIYDFCHIILQLFFAQQQPSAEQQHHLPSSRSPARIQPALFGTGYKKLGKDCYDICDLSLL